MLISLSEIMNTKDKVEHILAHLEMEKFIYDGTSYEFARKDPVNLTITNLGNKKVLIEGSVKLSLIILCSRSCLRSTQWTVTIPVLRALLNWALKRIMFLKVKVLLRNGITCMNNVSNPAKLKRFAMLLLI